MNPQSLYVRPIGDREIEAATERQQLVPLVDFLRSSLGRGLAPYAFPPVPGATE